MQSSLEFATNNPLKPVSTITPLPPLVESAFESSQIEALHEMFGNTNLISDSNENYTISPLFYKCAAVKVGDYVLGSRTSRFMTCSVVMLEPVDRSDVKLAEIHYFLKCDVNK